ncbi:MAG: hypothetical protein ABIR54_04490 [Burkholderiaceae bacterium]|jgi:hypothetical protein
MHVFAKDLLLALTIGAEVFAIAALWPLSEWALKPQRPWAMAGAMAVVLACVALDTHGLAFGAGEPGTLRATIGHALQWTVPPLFIVFPDAVCVASAQSLARAGVPARHARAVALFAAAAAVVVAPFATIVAGCSLAGACY